MTLLRPAQQDVADAVDYYLAEAGPAVAHRFLTAVEHTLAFLADFPEAGSLRFAGAIRQSDLRAWQVKGFPYLVFYRIVGGEPLILRILHAARDIPASLRE